ncbi:hypothetical protein J7E95_38405 [Streptomyces sp. ISL-14]|nr:hypothetical protein [Streptomyces sp. ISL-14]
MFSEAVQCRGQAPQQGKGRDSVGTLDAGDLRLGEPGSLGDLGVVFLSGL